MESAVRTFFERFEECFNRSLEPDTGMDMREFASLYASEFIAASPAGIISGRNDDQLPWIMSRACGRYQRAGLAEMRMEHLRLTRLDDNHYIVHVRWNAVFVRDGQSMADEQTDIHYFVQIIDDEPKIFGWVAGDQPAVLKGVERT